jgi:hypothetical protein
LAHTHTFHTGCEVAQRNRRERYEADGSRHLFPIPPLVEEEMLWFIDRLDTTSGWHGNRIISLADTQVIMTRGDAAGALGFGWFLVPKVPTAPEDVVHHTRSWNAVELTWPSFTQELVPVRDAVVELTKSHPGCLIVAVVDNAGLTLALNAGRAFDPRATDMMKEIGRCLLENDCELLARWCDRDANLHGDLLSRQATMREAWAHHCAIYGGDVDVVPPWWELTCRKHKRRDAAIIIQEWARSEIDRVARRRCDQGQRSGRFYHRPSPAMYPAMAMFSYPAPTAP